jgi:hypothetical protein
MTAEGLPLPIVRRVLRLAATIDRLAVAKCNGDWPADHGDKWPTIACSECGSFWHESAFRRRPAAEIRRARAAGETVSDRICLDCYTERAIAAILPAGFTVITGGDPRGYTTKITVPSGAQAYAGADGFGVPTRSR